MTARGVTHHGQFTPFPIATADRNSSYWNTTEAQTPDVALLFLATAQPDYLKNAPGGRAYLTNDSRTLTRGKVVFAERCARCHSSKLPERAFSFLPDDGCVGPNYLRCWNVYGDWTKTRAFKYTDFRANFWLFGNFRDSNSL
ncbi:MAG: hypothetical protein P8Z41_16850 [Anaerolineales bacterium]